MSDDVCQTVLQCYSLILDNYLFIYLFIHMCGYYIY